MVKNMENAKVGLQLSIRKKIKEKAKIVSAKTGMTISEIFEDYVDGLTEKDISDLHEWKEKNIKPKIGRN